MISEKIIQVIIFIHAAFGGLALLSGLVAILSKKGSLVHKKSGLIFFYSMLISAIIAMVVAVLPNHESPFLFAIGIFSTYFILTGFRALQFKKGIPKLVDKIISITMLCTAILMILLPLILTKSINIVLTAFGILSFILSFRDLKLYQNHEKLKANWLKIHLGKMMGGYIAATTAFVVVNNYFSSIYNWFIPAIIGIPYIFFWFNKLNKNI